MTPLILILYVLAFVLFLLAALGAAPVEPRRFQLVAAGLACIALAYVLGAAGPLFTR